MKSTTKAIFAFFTCLIISLTTSAQIPEWYKQPPVTSGYLYAAGMAKSSDLSMGHKKARTIALSELAKNYANQFENFAKTCDTIVGKNNIRIAINTLKTEHEANLSNIEEVEKFVDDSGDLTVSYLLIRVAIKDDIKQLKKAISDDDLMGKKNNKARLTEELNKL